MSAARVCTYTNDRVYRTGVHVSSIIPGCCVSTVLHFSPSLFEDAKITLFFSDEELLIGDGLMLSTNGFYRGLSRTTLSIYTRLGHTRDFYIKTHLFAFLSLDKIISCIICITSLYIFFIDCSLKSFATFANLSKIIAKWNDVCIINSVI